MQSNSKNATIRLIKVLGGIIKKHRIEQEKTMYKISAECSIHKSSWRLIEQGIVKDIKISTLWKMAEGLDVNPASIISEAKEILGDEFTISGIN